MLSVPLLLSPEQIALGQYGIRPIVTPSGTQGVFLQNVSALSITLNSRLGSIEIPPAFVVTLPMDENDQITFTATPSGINFPEAFPQYVDVSYSFVPVAPAGTGLFIVPTTGGTSPAVEVAITGSYAPNPAITNLTLLAHGTTATAVGVTSVNTPSIDVPAINPTHIVVAIYNDTGESVTGVYAVADAAIIDTFTGSALVVATLTPEGGDITTGTAASVLFDADAHPYVFSLGMAHFTFNLSAATAATGSLSWAVYGY